MRAWRSIGHLEDEGHKAGLNSSPQKGIKGIIIKQCNILYNGFCFALKLKLATTTKTPQNRNTIYEN